MKITLNGEIMTLPSAISVAALVEQLQLDTRKIAVERNLEIVPRETYGTLINEGDEIEIVHFIGGG